VYHRADEIVVCGGFDQLSLTGNSDNWSVLLDQKTLAVSIVQMRICYMPTLGSALRPLKRRKPAQ